MADLVFGENKPAAATHESGFATTKPGQEIVDKLYATPEPQRTLHPIDVNIATKVNANLTQLADETGMSLDAQAAERKDYGALMGAVGLDVTLAGTLHTAWTHERLAATRPVDDAREAFALEATAAVRDELRGFYGERQYEDLIARAQKFVASSPKLKAIVATGRVGSRPEIVRGLIEHVRAVNYR